MNVRSAIVRTTLGACRVDAGAPHALTSAAYAREFNEVERLGGTTSTRTAEQARIASWASVNPFSMINSGLRDIAKKRHLSTSQQARLFVIDDEHVDRRLAHRVLGEQGSLELLAATDGDPARG